jgi:PAS domain S-box-containing protein
MAVHRAILQTPKMASERTIDVFSHHTEATDDPRINGLDDGSDPFVAAVRATRMPMVITDPRQPDNPIVFVNDSFCRLSGYERAEILGRNCRFLQGPDTDREALREIREAVREKRSVQIDLRNYRKNGEPFWNRLLLGPVNGADGEPAYFFASQVDVTLERERMTGLENANAALIAELADRVRAVEMGEARLLAATAAADLGIWHLAPRPGHAGALRLPALQAELRPKRRCALHLSGTARSRASRRPEANARSRGADHRDRR